MSGEVLTILFGLVCGIAAYHLVKAHRTYPYDNWMQWLAGVVCGVGAYATVVLVVYASWQAIVAGIVAGGIGGLLITAGSIWNRKIKTVGEAFTTVGLMALLGLVSAAFLPY